MSELLHTVLCIVCGCEVECDFCGVFRCLRCRTEIDPMHLQQPGDGEIEIAPDA